MYNSKEYRLGIGIMMINDKNEIFLGNRSPLKNKKNYFTMPQGGILSSHEIPYITMCRELYEEIGLKMSQHCYFIAKSKYWYRYEFPHNFKYMNKYKGQMQQWFLIKFIGKESDIKLNLTTPQEFHSYIWSKDFSKHISKVKYKLYNTIYNELSKYIKPNI